ncbi:MAG: hypothetical protein KJ626_09535 [Verrucomicrobia bacterium]|nr:hypothetical protein [Verrucomicrobiota bacterium]
MSDRLENALRFLGYGDPRSARLWFVGIEEALGFEKPEDLDRIVKYPFTAYDGCAGSPTPVYAIMSQIVTGLLGQSWEDEWPAYRDRVLFSSGSEAVQANLYPLGKAHVSTWPQQYTDWLGLTADQYYAWVADENSGRFAFIRQTRSESENPLTICFGTTVWHDFTKCFALDESLFFGYQDVFRFYPEERVILTPFFWTGGKKGMTYARVQKLIDLINELGMNPYMESNQQESGHVRK